MSNYGCESIFIELVSSIGSLFSALTDMSRTGVVSAGDIIYACTEMLGYVNYASSGELHLHFSIRYSLDLALVLVALSIRAGAMDVTT